MGSLSSILTNISNAIPTLANKSASAIWYKIATALSINIDNTILEIQNTQNIIDQNIQTNNYGKSGYYNSAALQYEYGQSLSIDPVTLNWIYNPVDTSKQTISQAAFDESTLTLKVAYPDPTTGALSPLPTSSPDILGDFKSYMALFEIPGIPINIISLTGDVFNANFQITYYKQYNLANIQASVIAALNSFQNSFTYNGTIYLGDLSDYIKQNVPGIRDVEITSSSINNIAFVGSTKLQSGYFTYSPLIISSLNSSGPYIAI